MSLTVASDADGMQAMLLDLLALRASPNVSLDIGLPWDDAPVAVPSAQPEPTLDGGVGSLWAWRHREESAEGPGERMEYFTLENTQPRRVEIIDASGTARRLGRETCEQAIAEQRLWRTARPVVHAPKAILERIAQDHSVRIWLHPSTGIETSGRVRRRPLHAKVILVTAHHRSSTVTHALIGSANGSHAALARGVEQGGNVEACMLCRFEGEVTLRDLVPSLVHSSLGATQLEERDMAEPGVDLSAWVDDVVYDAAARTLDVHWRAQGPAPLGPWELRDVDRLLASGVGAPAAPTRIQPFELLPRSAEVTFLAGGGEWTLPIRVLDLAQLPENPLLTQLGLRELLALLGRRVGSERLAALRAERGGAGVDVVLDAVFGEGFGPTDVFKAWWGAAEELRLAGSVAAFRHRLAGPTGIQRTWQALREAPATVLSADEVWVYGCELWRELQALEITPGPDTPSKRAMLDAFCAELRADLTERRSSVGAQPWPTRSADRQRIAQNTGLCKLFEHLPRMIHGSYELSAAWSSKNARHPSALGSCGNNSAARANAREARMAYGVSRWSRNPCRFARPK